MKMNAKNESILRVPIHANVLVGTSIKINP